MPHKKKQWNWNNVLEGMNVLVTDLGNATSINGVVKETKRDVKSRMVDGKPIQSIQVASVTILCDDGTEIVVERDNNQYQVTLK